MATFTNRNRSSEISLATLSRIALADKSAVKECVDIYGGMVWSLAKKFTGSAGDAEKVVQEIFTDIWENAGRCDLTITDEEVWIALIARRRLSKYAVTNNIELPVNASNNISQINSEHPEKRLPLAG